MKSRTPSLLTAGAIGGATTLAYTAYRRALRAANERLEGVAQVIDFPQGPIEFAESGNGPAVLVSHGAGGGFDQGLDLARGFLDEKFRVIAPSRFGYLGTPLPADRSAEGQAEAYARLFDALQLDTAAVVGVSAGAPSALQFALKHPDRCTALVLVVPLAYAPGPSTMRPIPPLVNFLLGSDFLFWMSMKVAHAKMVQTVLGVPIDVYRNATPEERRDVDEVLRNIMPISRRIAGLVNEGVVASNLKESPLREMRVPTLVITAADDLYGTYETSLYTAEQIPYSKLVAFSSGGHLLVGHVAEARAHIVSFLKEAERPFYPSAAGMST